MNKFIFQLGLLAFFVSIVFFANQNHSIIDTLARSFMIFVGVVFFVTLVVTVGMVFTNKKHEEPPEIHPNPLKTHRKFDAKETTAEPVVK